MVVMMVKDQFAKTGLYSDELQFVEWLNDQHVFHKIDVKPIVLNYPNNSSHVSRYI